MSHTQKAQPTFSIRNVLLTTFKVNGRNLWGFVLVAFAIYLAGLAIQIVFFLDLYRTALALSIPAADYLPGAAEVFTATKMQHATIIGAVLSIIAALLVNALATCGTLRDSCSEQGVRGSLFRATLRAFPTTVAVAAMALIPLAAGFALFFVPGLLLLTLLWVAILAAVMERRLMSAFARSWAVTRGARWKVFGLIVVLFAGALATIAIFSMGPAILSRIVILPRLVPVVERRDFGSLAMVLDALTIAQGILASAVYAAVVIVLSVASAVSFLQLRDLSDGDPAAEQVAD
jgi:hypothetical protein